MNEMHVMNTDDEINTSLTLTLNVARLKEYHICMALHLVTLEKPAWINSILIDFEVI